MIKHKHKYKSPFKYLNFKLKSNIKDKNFKIKFRYKLLNVFAADYTIYEESAAYHTLLNRGSEGLIKDLSCFPTFLTPISTYYKSLYIDYQYFNCSLLVLVDADRRYINVTLG